MSEIIERLTALRSASASSERPRAARSSRTRSAIRVVRSGRLSSMVEATSSILDGASRAPPARYIATGSDATRPPVWFSTSAPLEPSPGFGPAVSDGIFVQVEPPVVERLRCRWRHRRS
jgi:hypothetical protein